METKEIDCTHIVALQDVNGTLESVEFPIGKPNQFLVELEAMVNNPNRTRWDMQSYVQSHYKKTNNYLDFIYPHLYGESYVDGVRYPEMKGYEELLQSWKDEAKKASAPYRSSCEEHKVEPNANVVKSLEVEAVAKLKLYQKTCFFKIVKRWIDACTYQEVANRLQQDSSVKMYSKENIGWNTFTHPVNDEVVAQLMTNFGYGSSSYFLLSVKYKGIAILPYSYLVNYYHAGMADITRYTRCYRSNRESWCAAFDFLKDFVNKSVENPETFVHTYIMHEVEEMMKGLESIADDPKQYIDRICDRDLGYCVISVQRMSDYDKRIMTAYPSEVPLLFKVEKITGALDFLNSLRTIAGEMEEVEPHIQRLLELNEALYPEVKDGIDKIGRRIESLNARKSGLEKQVEEMEDKIKVFEEDICKIKDNLLPDQSFSMVEYETNHPEFLALKNLQKKNQLQIRQVSNSLYDLHSFRKFLDESIQKLDRYLVSQLSA